MKETLKSRKGITLIALIITVILMLILAMVALSAIGDGGLFDKSQNVADRYKKESEDEKSLLESLINSVEKYAYGEAEEEEEEVELITYKPPYAIDKKGNTYIKENDKFVKMDTGFKAKELGEVGYPPEPERVILTTTGDIYKATDDNEFELSSDGNVKFSELHNDSYAISTDGSLYSKDGTTQLFGGVKVKKVAGEYYIKIDHAIDENGDIYNEDGTKTSDGNVKFAEFYGYEYLISTEGKFYSVDGTTPKFGGVKVKNVNGEYCKVGGYVIDENGDIYDVDGNKTSDGNVKFLNLYGDYPCYAISTEGKFYSLDGTTQKFGGVNVKNVDGKYCIYYHSSGTYCIDENGDIYDINGYKTSDGNIKFLEYCYSDLAVSTEGIVYSKDGTTPQFGGVKVKNIDGNYCIGGAIDGIYFADSCIDENGDVYREDGTKMSDGIVKFSKFYTDYYVISTEGVFYDTYSEDEIISRFGGVKVKNVNGEYCKVGGYVIDENGDIYDVDGNKTSDGNVKFKDFIWYDKDGDIVLLDMNDKVYKIDSSSQIIKLSDEKLKYLDWSAMLGAGPFEGILGYNNDLKIYCEESYCLIECVFPDSQILVSEDGKTELAKDLREGDNIVYYNEETGETEVGTVEKAYIHEKATSFVKYEFEDGTYLEVTDYHPIYTEEGWKSYTRRNGYELPEVGDKVKTATGWKVLKGIEAFDGEVDCYDFAVRTADGTKVNNYFANGTLVQGSY